MNKKTTLGISTIVLSIIILALVTYFKINNIPNTIFLREGKNVPVSSFIKVSPNKDNVSLFGILPVKAVSVRTVPNLKVYPGGQPLGVKINTKGVLVVALSDIDGVKGKISSPAAASGIEIGDSIIKIDDQNIKSSEDVARIVNASEGKEISITVQRNNKMIEKNIRPVLSNTDNKFKIGLWIRDSTAGVGTLTFYDAKTKRFAALGHPITDVDTGIMLKVNSGQIVSSSIISVKKGEKGNPGELRGIFVDEENELGKVIDNTQCGIFGTAQDNLINSKFNKPMEIALRNEIKEGPAKIITTIHGEEPKMYDIEIEKLLPQEEAGPKSMIIKITDKELLQKTGGIVQGMSGSPIIQNGKLIGAVTHVLINKPDIGYGIYIEWMLKDANILTK